MKELFKRIPFVFKYILLFFIATRLMLAVVGFSSQAFLYPFHGQKYDVWHYSQNKWLDIWGVWDTGWYLGIAKDWYSPTVGNANSPVAGQANYAFFPLYPALIRGLHYIVSDYFIAALIISNLALLIGCYLIYKLVKLDYGEKTARRAIKYLLIYPVSFILSGAFSEASFLALILGAFYFAKTNRWFFAGLCGFFLSLTRSIGVFVIIPLLYIFLKNLSLRVPKGSLREEFSHDRSNLVCHCEGVHTTEAISSPSLATFAGSIVPKGCGAIMLNYVRKIKQAIWLHRASPLWSQPIKPYLKISAKGGSAFGGKNLRLKILYLLLIPLGLGIWMLYNHYLTGDYLAFAHIQSAWKREYGNPFKILWSGLTSAHLHIFISAASAFVIIILTTLYAKKIGFAYWLVGMYSIFIPLSTGIDSLPRLSLTAFPTFIILAIMGKNKILDQLLTITLAVLLGFFMVFWVDGFGLIV